MNIRRFYLKRFSLTFGILKILKKKAFQVNFVDFSNYKNHEYWGFGEFYHFQILIKSIWASLENLHGKNLDLQVKMYFTCPKLFLGRTDFTEGYLKIL